MDPISSLLRLADLYASSEGIELSTVSWRVFGDTKKMAALRNGADIQVRRFEGALAWFSAHWPESAEWPAELARPEPAQPEAAE